MAFFQLLFVFCLHFLPLTKWCKYTPVSFQMPVCVCVRACLPPACLPFTSLALLTTGCVLIHRRKSGSLVYVYMSVSVCVWIYVCIWFCSSRLEPALSLGDVLLREAGWNIGANRTYRTLARVWSYGHAGLVLWCCFSFCFFGCFFPPILSLT